MTSKARMLAKLRKEKLRGKRNAQLLLVRIKSLNKEMARFGTFMENLPDLADEFLVHAPYNLLDKIETLASSLGSDSQCSIPALGSLQDVKSCMDDAADSARDVMGDAEIDEREEKRWQSKPGRRERKSRPNLGRGS